MGGWCVCVRYSVCVCLFVCGWVGGWGGSRAGGGRSGIGPASSRAPVLSAADLLPLRRLSYLRLPCAPQGGHIPAGDGNSFVQPRALATVKQCCQACQAMAACGAYVYDPRMQMCYFKVGTWVCACWWRWL